MPCACDRCLQHARTLGLPPTPPSHAAIHKAFRQAARRWHPDQFENDPGLRPEAEERFKRVQIAYRELTAHHERPVAGQHQASFNERSPSMPFIFGSVPGCYAAPNFPAYVEKIARSHLGQDHELFGIVDLTRPGMPDGDFSQFFLLSSHALILRNRMMMVSLLWYSELGKITLIDRRRDGRLTLWQRMTERFTGPQQNYSLEIYRRNGSHFYSLAPQVDDSVKRVIYNFLLRRKLQAHR